MTRTNDYGYGPKDYLANEVNDQEPIKSNIGRGPEGRGITINNIVHDAASGTYTFDIVDTQWGELITQVPNLSGGVWRLMQADSDTIHFQLYRGGIIEDTYEVTLPKGASGARSVIAKDTIDWPFPYQSDVQPGIRPDDYDAFMEYEDEDRYRKKAYTNSINLQFSTGDLKAQGKPPQIGDLIFTMYKDKVEGKYPTYGLILGYVNDIEYIDGVDNTDVYNNRIIKEKGIHAIGYKVLPFLSVDLIKQIYEEYYEIAKEAGREGAEEALAGKVIEDANADGKLYGRKDNEWEEIKVTPLAKEEIKELYESNQNTNVFTDEEKGKLSLINTDDYVTLETTQTISGSKTFQPITTFSNGITAYGTSIINQMTALDTCYFDGITFTNMTGSGSIAAPGFNLMAFSPTMSDLYITSNEFTYNKQIDSSADPLTVTNKLYVDSRQVFLTQSEYDTLVANDEIDEDVYYNIPV